MEYFKEATEIKPYAGKISMQRKKFEEYILFAS
jgi:hypothetical protein